MKKMISAKATALAKCISAMLNRKTQHWNRASKLIALVLFVLLFGGMSLYLIIKSI